MRGKASFFVNFRWVRRITPAYAGKSSNCQRQNSNYQDHPRLCGEKENGDTVLDVTVGSPPPMRGKDPAYV